jgi:hypothetical protein
MFDVFYSGKKPNLFVHECRADSMTHAQALSRTRYFWWITYLADYSTHDWDFQPVPWQSEYTHTWPSQHHEYSGTYLVPRSGEIKYHFHKKIIPNRPITDVDTLVANAEFDLTWAPHPHDPPYTYVFGNQWWPANQMPTIEYHVPGATERKYMDKPQARLPATHNNNWHTLVDCEWDYSWVPDPGDPPLTYVFGNQWWPAEKMPTVEYHVPGATERKYMTWPRAQLLQNDARWTVPDTVAHTDIDFSWVPDPGEPAYIYQFATQHQKTGGPVYCVPGAVEVKYLAELKIRTVGNATAIYEIDHMDGAAGQIANTTRRVRYFDNYRDTLIRLAKSIGTEHEYVWVCSSICDYTDFDFSWHPEQWQSTMLHVFASNEQKFGDTFFMHVPTFAEYAERKALLEWYDCNFVDSIVPRQRMPVIEHVGDSNVDAVKTTEWSGPVALFTTNGMPMTIPAVNLWRSETKTITPLSSGASAVVVPKSAVPYIKTQMYDYPYIDKTQQQRHGDDKLDIVFISNGELNAKSNFLQMTMYLANESRYTNRVHLVEGINGRAAAYHAAAGASTTPWFFAVFAKLEVNQMFDWSWQPDRMQEAKHYIFHALNPVNGLVYGHQAMIAYNRQLVLDNPGVGLDFTLDSPHEVVPILSGVAHYDTSPWSSWRTAFRECIKLKASLPDVENEYRLNKWLDINSDEADPQWSRIGAEDAVEYYNQVNGDFAALKKSYEWEWLATYAFVKRNLLPGQ